MTVFANPGQSGQQHEVRELGRQTGDSWKNLSAKTSMPGFTEP